MSKEYKLTKGKILAMADECEDVKRVLKKVFPDAFEDEWIDITKACEWKLRGDSGCYFIKIFYYREEIGYIDTEAFKVNEHSYKLEREDSGDFRILKKK